MSATKSTSKSQADRLTLIEEEMLFLKEVPDTIRFLEERVTELNGKVVQINAMGNRLDGLTIAELMFRVALLEERVAPRAAQDLLVALIALSRTRRDVVKSSMCYKIQ